MVIGIVGVGQYMVQEGKALGASTVIDIDIMEERLIKIFSYRVDFSINSSGKKPKDIS